MTYQVCTRLNVKNYKNLKVMKNEEDTLNMSLHSMIGERVKVHCMNIAVI